MKIKITVTKDILKRSMMCGIDALDVNKNCAIAHAVRDLFPLAVVTGTEILFHNKWDAPLHKPAQLPKSATGFISQFDRLWTEPEKRLEMPELSFEVNVPDSVIDETGIAEVHEILRASPTLELAEA